MTQTEQTRHRMRRRLALLTGLALAVGGAAASPASANSNNNNGLDAGTTTQVGGATQAPVIECTWALTDVDHSWKSTPKMTYGLDDNPVADAGFPCVDDGAGGATMPNPYSAANMTSVRPNADDLPTEAYVELWGAVSSSNANPIVYFDVYHPDGSLKVQIDATQYANSANPTACNGPAGMFQAALDNKELTSAAIANIKNECMYQQKGLYYGAFGISKHQPYGIYRIEMTAASAGGAATTQTIFIEVLPFYQLEKDFTTVDFGTVGPNSHFWQPTTGDFTWDGTNSSTNQNTSVRNTGNAGIGLDVRFASMCLTTAPSCTDDKRIDHFDAKFGKVIAGMQSMGHTGLASALQSNLASTNKPAPYGNWYSFDNDINRTLCPNDVAKIEFSIYTENIQAGTYSAIPNGIGLRARPNAKCPTDLGAPYMANGYTGDTPTSTEHWS